MDTMVRAIADPTRRDIVRLIGGEGELAAGEIAARFRDISRPAVSQHLRVLREAQLVDQRRDGTRRLYRLRPDRLAQLRRYLEGFWDERLSALKREAEGERRGGRDRRGRARDQDRGATRRRVRVLH